MKLSSYEPLENDGNIFKNGVFQDGRQRDNKKNKNIISLAPDKIE